MTRLLNRLLLGTILIFGLPFYWLMLNNSPGDSRHRDISISQLRELAKTGEGVAPTAIRYEQVASKLRSRNLLAAGSGMRFERHYAQIFMLDVPGAKPILIDTGMSAVQARRSGFGKHYEAPQKNVEKALKEASIIVTLGEGIKHEGGLAESREQASTNITSATIITAATDNDSTSPFVISHGIVVIPATGLLDNSRLIYVRQQDGQEVLFTGDASPSYRNWMHLRAPSRLVTDYLKPQDRKPIYKCLSTIRSLQIEAPDLMIIPGNQLPGEARLHQGFPDADGQP